MEGVIELGRIVRCTKCHKLLDEIDFIPSQIKMHKKGLTGVCRKCQRERSKTKWADIRKGTTVKERRPCKNPLRKTVCSTLRSHRKNLENDPNRLTTEFMKDLLGKPRCKEPIS